MQDFFSSIGNFFSSDQVRSFLRAGAVLAGGLLIWWLARRRLRRSRMSPQYQFLVRRAVSVIILVVTITWALRELGMSLGVVLGAAGIFTVAIGFAAQTSVSNIISGVFLMGERPFVVGDMITVGTTTGEVISIDLLSVKLRTNDNLQVRVPNEAMLKSNVTNISRFPIRRIDLKVPIAYQEDLARVRGLLSEIADRHPLCLSEPKPLFILLGFGDSSIDVQFSVWTARENFLDLKNTLLQEIKKTFDRERIEIPFPHRSLYAGNHTAPLPVQLVTPAAPAAPAAEPAAQ